MTQPTIPVIPYSMSSEMGDAIGLHLDANFEVLVESTTEIITNLGLIQRDDGNIRSQTVTADTFSSDALALMAGSSVSSDLDWRPRGDWVTATLYDVGNIVQTGTPAVAYVCAVQHVSGTFNTDYIAGKWVVLSSPRQLTSADVVSALTYTPVNKAGDTMTGALVMVTGSKIGGASGMEFDDALLATQDLITIDKGFYSAYESSKSDMIYGFAANVVRMSGNYRTIGAQCSAIVGPVAEIAFGSNFNAIGLSGTTSALVGQEIDVGSFTPNNTANKYGLNLIFFDRGGTNPGEYNYVLPSGTYANAGGGLGSNYYNKNAKAVVIESQERSATGEYCGWTRGIHFGEYSLDSETDAAYSGSRAYPIGIDFSAMHYYGGTDPVTAFNLEAALALRDFQTIWWNRDPATAATTVDKVKTYFNPAVQRWVLENGGAEKIGFDVTTGDIYQNGSILATPGLATNNTWTGTNTFNNTVTLGANLVFSGNSRRIMGDFSNATIANRTFAQTTAANSSTEFGVIPSGTGGECALYMVNDSAALAGQVGRIAISGTEFQITAGRIGGAAYVPITFGTQGLEFMRITGSVARQLLINATSVTNTSASLRVNGIIQCDNPVSFSVHRNAVNFAVNDNTPTVVAFTTEVWDTNLNFDTGTSRFTPPAGKYQLTGAVCCAAGAGVDQSAIVVAVYKNGAQYKSGNFATMSGTGVTGSAVSCLVDANGTDYFQLYVTQVSGAPMTMTGAATDTYFQGFRMS